MSAHRVSRALYRRMIRLYPADFRERFGGDLERDFADLLTQRGVCAAWRRVSSDWSRSLTDTHAYAHGERRRLPIPPPGERPMSSLMFDVRHAVRALARAPVFTGVTVLTLALGIGANSAIFSLVNAVLIRPVGYHQPERLMMIYEGIPEANIPRIGVSPSDFIDLTQYQQSFTDIGAYRNRPFELSGTGEPEELTVAQVTPSVFTLLGVSAAMGRTLADTDTRDAMVAVLSHGLWQRRFGGRNVLGEQLTLNRVPYTIVGVMPGSFQFPRPWSRAQAQWRTGRPLGAVGFQPVRAAGAGGVLQPQCPGSAEGWTLAESGGDRYRGTSVPHS